MANRMKRPCRYPGCPEIVSEGGYCEKHQRLYRQQQDRNRGSAAARGYDARWRQYRQIYLRDHPLCVRCLDEGRLTPAVVVDHIKPHKGDWTLFWEPANHQALCKRCHDVKTAREDGGFGN